MNNDQITPNQPSDVPTPQPLPTEQSASPAMPEMQSPQIQPLAAPSPEPIQPMVSTPQPQFSAPAGGPQIAPIAQPKSKKKVGLIAGAVLAILLIAGGVFGLYLPNTQANVWNTGINRSGKALNALTVKATDPKTLQQFTNTDMKATISGKLDGADMSGSMNMKFNETKLDGSLNVKIAPTGTPKIDAGLSILAETIKGKKFPLMYLKVTGIKDFGGEFLPPSVQDFDNKWISIDEDFINENIPAELNASKETDPKTPSAADVAEVTKVATEITNSYLLTTDSQKEILIKKSFVGKETVDGIKAYHYIVGINIAHAKDWCVAMVDGVTKTEAYKKIAGDAADDKEVIESAKKSCKEDVFKDLKESDTIDLWIDAKYKLLYKVRLTDEDDTKTYVDIGQKYTGGDDITMFIVSHDDKNKKDAKFNISTNMKTNNTKGDFTYGSSTSDSENDLKISMSASPFKEEINASKPAGAIPIKDVLKKLGIDPSDPSSLSSF